MLKAAETSFNTQPPEGGWIAAAVAAFIGLVSTHSRLKAAGAVMCATRNLRHVSTHSRLKAAGTFYVIDDSKTMFQHTAA